MKAKLCLVLPLFFISVSLIAQKQKTEKSKVTFGISAGPNLTSASLESYTPTEPGLGRHSISSFRFGFNANVFVSMPVGKKFSLQPEIGFELLNQKQFYSDSYLIDSSHSSNFTDHLSESEIFLKVFLKYKVKFYYISAGSQIGIITSAKTKSVYKVNADNGILYYNNIVNFKQIKQVNSPAFTLLFGLSKDDLYKNWGVGIYYRLGLSNYTSYNNLRQIGKINGLLLQANLNFR